MQKPEQLLMESVFQKAPMGIGIAGLDGVWHYVNETLCLLTGYSEEELLASNVMTITRRDDWGIEEVERDRLLKGDIRKVESKEQFIHKSGFIFWMNVSVIITAESGQPSFVFYMDPADDRDQPVLDLLLHDQVMDMICRIRMDGELLYISSASKTMLGYEPKELIGQSGWGFIHPEDRESVILYVENLKTRPLEKSRDMFRLIRKDGGTIWIEAAIRIVRNAYTGEPLEILGVFRDVTIQKQQEEQLRVKEELYKLISEHAQDIISYVTPDGIFRYVSPAVRTMLGYEPEELIGQSSYSFIHEDDVRYIFNSNLLQHSDMDLFQLRWRNKKGVYIWFESTLKIIRDEEGSIVKVLGVARDITERKLAEEEFIRREGRFRDLVEQSPDAIIISSQGQWLYVNDTTVQLLGAKNKAEVLANYYSFIHPDYAEAALEQFKRVERGEPTELLEQQFIRLDGRVIDVEVKSLPSLYQNAPVVHTIVRDITERKRTQEMLRASEKLNIAGQLAAGIAHEIRNPLTSLKGFLKFIQSGFGSKEEHFAIMREEIDRIELIVNELLVLAKPGHRSDFREIDMCHLLRQVITLLEAQAILNGVELVFRSDIRSCMNVNGDENQLKQVFINIIKNAIEAMTDGGEIGIEVKHTGTMIHICVIDQGSGMPEESIGRMGEPFYTTKQTGTGLGLTVSFNIVEQHGGRIRIQSKPGQGTIFDISLPAVAKESLVPL